MSLVDTPEVQSAYATRKHPSRPSKRRAARACQSCRSRKVRCDVVKAIPCFNCRTDGFECVLATSRRKRLQVPQGVTRATYPIDTSFENENEACVAPEQIPRADRSSQHNIDLSWSSGTTQNAAVGSDVPRLIDPSQNTDFLGSQDTITGELGKESRSKPPCIARPLGHLFLKPPSRHMDAVETQYLFAKGALTLPSVQLQNELLGAFVEYVYPYMPLLDLHDLMTTLASRDGTSGQVSLLLYQAILFSATAFVDIRHLQKDGFATRMSARKLFYRKTRLLYDVDYETDRFVLVQSLLLMTYWYETSDELKDTWHWMGLAVSLAQSIGLHRDPGKTSLSANTKRLWKRLWWSCYMRDRLVSLGMRRPIRINDEDSDVPMLSEDDFDLDRLEDDGLVMPSSCESIRNMALQRELVSMCISKSQLCVLVGCVLHAQYSTTAKDTVATRSSSNGNSALMEEVDKIHQSLMIWFESLPGPCRYDRSGALDVETGRSMVVLHRTLLHMVYHTTVYALFRPCCSLLSRVHVPETSQEAQDLSYLKVRQSVSDITLLASELHDLRLDRFLPTTGITVILSALSTHLLEMKSPLNAVRQQADQGYRRCSQVMNQLRQIYAAAEYATALMDTNFQRVVMDLTPDRTSPLLSISPGEKARSDATNIPPDIAPYMTPTEVMFSKSASSVVSTDVQSAHSWLHALESTRKKMVIGGRPRFLQPHELVPMQVEGDPSSGDMVDDMDFLLDSGSDHLELIQALCVPEEDVSSATVDVLQWL